MASTAPTHPVWTRRDDGFLVVYPEHVPMQISQGGDWIAALVLGITLASAAWGADPTAAMSGPLYDAITFTVVAFVILPLSFIGMWRWLVEPRLRPRQAVWRIDASPTELVVQRVEEGVDDELATVPLADITAARFEPGRLVVEVPGFPLYVPLSESLPYAGSDIVKALQEHLARR
jgi:hypothetical protein